MNNKIQLHLYVLNLAIYFLTVSWLVLYDKHKCKCGNNWHQVYMRLWSVYMLFHILLIQNSYLDYLLIIGQLVFIVVTLFYIQDIAKQKCKCSDQDKERDCKFYLDIIIIFIALMVYLLIT